MNKKYQAKHYQLNKDKYKLGAKNRREGLKCKLKEYKKTLKCIDCGYNKHIEALDFDHLAGKFKNISQMIVNSYSWGKILEEISKCEVRCANCHRVKTHERRNLRD